MWSWRRHRPRSELQKPGEAYLGTTNVDGSAVLPPAPYPAGTQEQRRPAPNLVIGAGAPSAVCSAYNHLRTQIVIRLQNNGWNTVAVTSPARASGNTLAAINLAISIARDFSYTVVLVELDLVHPSFHQVLKFKQRKGIVDYLLRDAPIEGVLLNPGIDRLVVIPAGSPVANASELLSSPKMTQLMEELKLRYERPIILFDLPSVLASDGAIAFSPFVDCALLMVEEGETRVEDVRRALDQLKSTNILGIVLNRSIHVDNQGKMIWR
jgi:protein-tyrosine kinase